MIPIEDFHLNYIDCPDRNQYSDIKSKAHSVVDARYLKKPGYEGYADICALPFLSTNQELTVLTSQRPKHFSRKAIENMSTLQRKEALLSLQNAFFPLEHLFDVAYAIDSALISSYAARESLYSLYPVPNSNVISLRIPLSSRALCFSLTGVTGCGKTVAVNQVKNLYPAGIRHYTKRYEYIQIPILMSTSFVGNMIELMTSLAGKIDEILDTGTFHADKMKRRSVGNACNYLKELIKRYHIGLLIIDEVQFMRFDSGNTSFENLIGIAEETGVALGIIGNEEVCTKLGKYPRIISRIMLHQIHVTFHDSVSISFFENALMSLWEYQWTKTYTPLTEDIKNQLAVDSMYNIALLKAILIRLQFEAIKKTPKEGITPRYIHSIATKYFSQIQSILYAKSTEEERKILELIEADGKAILAEIVSDEKRARLQVLKDSRESRLSSEKQQKLEDAVIVLTSYYDHTESYARRAINLCEKENECFMEYDVHKIVDIVHKRLEKTSKAAEPRKRPSKRINQEDIDAVNDAITTVY